MKRIILAWLLIAIFLPCCKEKLINDEFDIYGVYESCDSKQEIYFINFADGQMQVKSNIGDTLLLDTTYFDYKTIDSNIFTKDNKHLFEIYDFDKNKSMTLVDIEKNRLNHFCD